MKSAGTLAGFALALALALPASAQISSAALTPAPSLGNTGPASSPSPDKAMTRAKEDVAAAQRQTIDAGLVMTVNTVESAAAPQTPIPPAANAMPGPSSQIPPLRVSGASRSNDPSAHIDYDANGDEDLAGAPK